jgi:hypothetical protein
LLISTFVVHNTQAQKGTLQQKGVQPPQKVQKRKKKPAPSKPSDEFDLSHSGD